MVRKSFNISLAALLLLTGSCFSEDVQLTALQPDWMEIECDLSDQTAQMFLNMETREVVSQNSIHSWDMAFDCREDSFTILLNWARGMASYNTGLTRLTEYEFDEDVDWKFERIRSGISNSSIGAWGDFGYNKPQSFGIYYLLSLGYNAWGQHMGYILMSIRSFEDNAYHIEFADPISPKESYIFSIPKKKEAEYTYFSFRNGGQILEIEPKSSDWQLMTTSMVSDERKGPYDLRLGSDHYLNYGILLNPSICSVAIDSTLGFDNIRYVDALNLNYHNNPAGIGNSWYEWNAQNANYSCRNKHVYVLKLKNGQFLKLMAQNLQKEGSKYRMKIAVQNL